MKQLKPDDEVALMCFNEQVYVLHDFTKNKGLVEEKLRGVVAQRPTLTRQALLQASTHLQKATAAESRRVIVILTDNLSSTPGDVISERVVMQQLSVSDSVVCGVIVPNPVYLLPPGAVVRRKPTGDIIPYIEETGGIKETVKKVTPEEISTRLVKTIDAFRHYYRIEYLPTNSKRDGKHRKIKVTLSQRAKKTGGKLTVLAKQGYFATDDTK
jgi:VWFA-related protein